MPSYDLYASLGLDRSQSPEQIAAELDHRLEGVTRDTPQWNELAAARAVLGDPVRRQMYDQRLSDPSQTVTPAEIQQLAAMNVGAASGSAKGGFLGRMWRESPKLTATAGVLTVAVLVVGGLAIGGAVGGGDDDDTSNAAAGSNAAPQTEIADDDPHAAEKRQFREYDFLSADQEYSVDADEDGTEDYAISVGNLRTATYVHDPKSDIMEPYEVTAGCVDITARLSDSAMADIRKGVDRDLGQPYDQTAVTWGERQGVSHQFEASSTRSAGTDYDAAMKAIANDTWGLNMQWMKHGDNKWTGTVAPIVEDSRIWDKDYSEIVSIPRSLEDPADSEFRGDSTVQTRCFNGQFGWGAEDYPADDSVTGYYVYPYISTVSSDRSEREHTGWKFDK